MDLLKLVVSREALYLLADPERADQAHRLFERLDSWNADTASVMTGVAGGLPDDYLYVTYTTGGQTFDLGIDRDGRVSS